jgi:hypothetical protein
VPIYLHDWFAPGRHALVVSTRSSEYKQLPERYRAEPQVTGDESRLVEVHDVPFPNVLHPADDLSPATVVTHVRRDGEKLHVRGTTSDDGEIKQVLVNGLAAEARGDNFSQWEAAIPLAAAVDSGPMEVRAHAEDAAGNIEPRAHVLEWQP